MVAGKNDSAASEKSVGRGAIGQALSLGSNLAAGMAVFSFIGYWIDRRRGGGTFWTLCGMFLGVLYGAYEVWKVVRSLNHESKDKLRGTKEAADRK